MSYTIKYLEIYPQGMKAVFAINTTGEVQFEIPATFDIASIKPLIANNVDIAYFQTRMLERPHYIPPELQELNKSIIEKQQQLRLLESKMKLLESETLFASLPERIGVDAAAYIREVRAIKLENAEESARLAAQYEALLKEIDILASEFNRRLPKNVTSVIELRTGIRSGELLIEAFCRYAGWTPSYRFNLNAESGNIEAAFLAEARQHSGLSFTGEIRLFTQNPSTKVMLPKLHTWSLDFKQQAAPKAMMRSDVLSQSEIDYPLMEAAAAEPVVAESLVNISISATAKTEGDGTPVSLELKKFNISSKHKVLISHAHGEQGWLVCSAENMPEPILPGQVMLYVDGQSSGSTSIGYIGRGEKAEISFGQMPLVKIKKHTYTAVSGTNKGLLSSSGSVEDGYKLEVTNGTPIELDIELLDRVPFPVNDKITVDLLAIEPVVDENKENVLKWKIKLKAGEKREFIVKYRIKYPVDKKLAY